MNVFVARVLDVAVHSATPLTVNEYKSLNREMERKVKSGKATVVYVYAVHGVVSYSMSTAGWYIQLVKCMQMQCQSTNSTLELQGQSLQVAACVH